MKMVKQIAVLAFAALMAQCGWAAIGEDAVVRITAADIKAATWSDAGSATINGCTVNLNGNTKNDDGTISIITTAADGETDVDKGVTVDVPTADGKYTAIVKYSNYTRSTSAYTYTLGMACNRDSDYGITDNSGTYRGFYSTSRHYSFGNNPAAKAAGYLMISYHNASGTACYVGETPAGYVGGNTSSIKWANSTVSGINIGGKRTAQPDDFLKPASMTIEEVILVKGVYSQDTGSLDELKKLYATKEVVQKYGYDFNGSYTKEAMASTALTLGGSINDSDCQVDGVKDKALSFATGHTGNYWGTSFSYGVGDWTLIASVKAPAANQCILSVGGEKGTTGLIGLRNAGNNKVAAFTKDGTDLTSVTLDSDPTTSYHVYAIVYDSTTGKVKMNVDGGTFTEGVAFTPSTNGGFQYGGIYRGQIAGIAANANSGALDEFRFYSTALTQADTQELAADLLDLIVIPEGEEKTVGQGETLSANGVVVDGTLKFTEDASSLTAITRYNQFSVSGSGLIDLSETKGQSAGGNNLRIAIRGADHTFSGDVNVPANVNLVFAAADTDCTGMMFSGGGFVCVLGTAVNLDGTWTTQTGAYIGAGATLKANGGTLTGRLYFCDNTNLALGSLTETSLTVAGERFETAGTVHISLPSGTPSDDKVKLISWKKTQNVTAARLDVSNIPDGYEVTYDESGLYLSMIEDSTETVTSAVSNSLTLPVVHLGNGGVQQFAGVGGVQIRDLAIREGGKLVVDPVKNPVYVTGGKPTLEAGAKIELAEVYANQTAGVFDLLTWDGAEEITIPDGLVDIEGAALSQFTYTTSGSLDSQARVNKTYTVLKLDLKPSAEKQTITIMPLGDSITEGTNIVGFGNPNYRSFLLAKLAAKGYTVKSTGFRSIKNMNTAGVFMPEEWSWHNGVSGQRLVSAPARVGWRDALEATLDASEIPDIITFKIGTNDQGTNVDQLYAEWVAVMKRIIAARPATKIVVGSIMNINGSTWQDGWNAKLKEAVENNLPGFPANQVFFADLNKANPRRDANGTYLGTFYSESDLHPNWIGHELNAECWADAIAAALVAPACGTFTPNETTGAVNNVGEEYRKGFTHLATFTPNNAAITKGTAPAYSYKNADAAEKPLTKIAYYMELKNTRSGNVRYIWADMDAFAETKTLAGMGIPTDYTFTGDATNLHIDTNDGGIEKIAPTVSGRTAYLQFTQGGMISNQVQDGAPAGFFTWDWADKVNDSGSYGAMNLYLRNPTPVDGGVADKAFAAQTLLAFSRYATADQQIGIGNCAIHGAPLVYGNIATPVNYMETYQFERLDLASYELATIEIWGVPESTTPEYVPADKVAEYESWVETHTEELKLATPEQAKAGFLLNCAPTSEAIATAEKEFKLKISFDAEGNAVVETTEKYIVSPTIQRSSDLKTWGEEGNFYRAVFAL